MPKSKWHDGQRDEKKVLRKMQTSKRCYELAPVFRRDARLVPRIQLWPVRLDDRSGVLIGADGTWRSDWPARESIDSLRARSDR